MAKKKAPERLANYGKKDRDVVTERINDWMGHELVITGGSFRSGEHGEFAIFEATDENDHSHTFVSGAMFVLDALHDASEQKAFPLAVEFYLEGRTVMFK